MCFSAGASFVASAVLVTTGVVSFKKVSAPLQLMLAGIPLLFGIQQFIEGILWLSLRHPGYDELEKISTNIFLIFSHMIWPLWVPLSVLMLEKEKNRRKLLYLFASIGGLVAIYLGYCLVTIGGKAEVAQYHIHYSLNFPDSIRWLVSILYILATIGSTFTSSKKGIRWIGLVILSSLIFSFLFFRENIISIWCFFAAVISLLIMVQIPKYSPDKKSIIHTA